jgi:ATP-dependent HslUV protease ATP-binding subunit HslU
MTEPEANQIKQQIELLKTEGVTLRFSENALKSIAQIAADINSQVCTFSLFFYISLLY